MIKFQTENLNLFYGAFHALKNVNLSVPEKEITAFIGPSGCGKSTLLKTLNRMNDLVEGCRIEGRVLLDGADIYSDLDPNILRKRVVKLSAVPPDAAVYLYLPVSAESDLISRNSLISRETVACVVL